MGALNFNPRSREGSDLPDEEYDDFSDKISIHAPVKGATHPRGLVRQPGSHFNPRSREGSDTPLPMYPRVLDIFQSTLP